jgi:hypothetical protein
MAVLHKFRHGKGHNPNHARCNIIVTFRDNEKIRIKGTESNVLLCWYLHFVVVGELEYPNNPDSYATGSLATGRVTLGGQVEG